MIYNKLGRTELNVSMLCFGSLTLGPLQKNIPLMDGVDLLKRAIDVGVNFIDTADLYGTYPYIKEAIKYKNDLIVASKSYAYDRPTAEQTLERALKEIDRDYIDIFLLHEQESRHTLNGHKEALSFYLDQKDKGKIRAVGLSTHYVSAVRSAAMIPEVDVIHPILNYRGLGIVDGSRDNMEDAVKNAYEMGKGIYVMKPLGGGHLISEYINAMDYIMKYPFYHSVAIGMQRIEELYSNVHYLLKKEISEKKLRRLSSFKRKLHIQDWCIGCGRCVEVCSQNALYINESGQAIVDQDRCIFCGYCGAVCKELAIKVI